MLVIKNPIWKTRSIGIAEFRIKEYNKISVDYRDSSGELVFPFIYGVSGERARTYPQGYTNKGRIRVRVIPIEELDKCEERIDFLKKGKR